MQLLDVVEVTEDRFQVVDARGRFVAGYNDATAAQAFVDGYTAGRQDAVAVVSSVVDGLGARIGRRA